MNSSRGPKHRPHTTQWGRPHQGKKTKFASESTTPTSPKESPHIKGSKQLVPEGPKHRLYQKKWALQKLISCLEVNKTDFTKKCTAKQICLKVTNNDHTQKRAPTVRVNKIRASGSKRSTSHRRALQNISASRSKNNDPTQRRAPTRKSNKKKPMKAQTPKDERPNSHKILKQNPIQ